MFGNEGPVFVNDQGLAVGPCIIAKSETPKLFATKVVGNGWHQLKLYPFGEPNPDIIEDLGWIPATEVRREAMRRELGIVWA